MSPPANVISNSIVTLVVAVCGAAILLLLHIWLRRRTLPNHNLLWWLQTGKREGMGLRAWQRSRRGEDTSLLWLAVSILSWAVAAGMDLFFNKWLDDTFHIKGEGILYLFSPVSSIIFANTAFNLARVRERVNDGKLRSLRFVVPGMIALFSAIAWVLLTQHNSASAQWDALASCIALIALGGGLTYSFLEYDNEALAWLTIATFLSRIFFQFYRANHSGPLPPTLAALNMAGTMMLIMLCIALAVAWGLSDTSRIRLTGTPTSSEVIVMFLDLRGSTQWSESNSGVNSRAIAQYLDSLFDWVWQLRAHFAVPKPTHVKFLGDGYMFVWREDGASHGETLNRIAQYACAIAAGYAQQAQVWNVFRMTDLPPGIGIGVGQGAAMRLPLENGSEDYLGSPVNSAEKMQGLAKPNGVVISSDVYAKLETAFQEQFPNSSRQPLGTGRPNLIYATRDVAFPTVSATPQEV